MSKNLFPAFLILLLSITAQSQDSKPIQSPRKVFTTAVATRGNSDLFGSKTRFIENIGQYGDTLAAYGHMGKILFGYEGLDMPVLFTPNGLIHLQRKITYPSREEKEEMEHTGMEEEEVEKKVNITERVITMEWINANPDAQVIVEDTAEGYQTYGLLQQKAYSFKRIVYKDIYPGIDLVYSIAPGRIDGFEYSLILKPYANLNTVKVKFGGNVKSLVKDKNGNLSIRSDIGSISETIPVSYYGDQKTVTTNAVQKLMSRYAINNGEISFEPPVNYDRRRSLVLDPFISSTSTLTGSNTSKAKDVDFDYAGNVFVTGGGDGNVYKLAKFDASGVLQWTFNGTLTVPAWSFGTYYGGWVVEKTTGNTYLGQGFAPINGFQIVRLNASGLYDNYITTGNPLFREDWKMLWTCNNGSPQIIVAGGGTNSDINFGLCSPPSTTLSSVNVTGIPYTVSTGWAQDISDIVIDPVTNDMYTIYGSLIGTPSLSNMIYKNTAPYSGTSVAWNLYSGYISIQEIANRPYLLAGQIDNSSNVFAVNSSYLFYWDGKNLKAFDKATGAGVGTPITIAANTLLMQGGIFADECNNIFIGSANGTIKVYKFNGSTFDDAADPDITVTGFTTKSVYDLVNNDAQKLLYACGDGFVASFDITSYACGSAVYTASVITDCVNHSATVTLSPTPPINTTITYTLYDGALQIASNTTGVFAGLSPNVTYTVHATVNAVCSGVETVTDFMIVAPNLSTIQTNATCGNSNGSITATGTGGSGALTYSKDGNNYQSSGSFTGLAAGIYTIYVKDANGCANSVSVNIINSNGPTVTLTGTDAFCGTSNGTITATGAGGSLPYQYSINNGPFQSGNVFSGLTSGSYLVTIKDVTNCTNSNSIIVNSFGGTTVTANATTSTCGNSNGSITANVTGGNIPYSYSINGFIYQNSNVFTGLASGTYTLTVKDANNCINSTPVTISNVAGPSITASASPTSCNSFTGVVTITATGGAAPLQYSINAGATFQSSNLFTSLSAGTYIVTVKDANGCINTTTVLVNLSIPQVTDSTTVASCTVNDGTITGIGTGGILPYQYSINGFTFQSSNIFNGLGAGTYSLTIRDAAGCTNTISPVVITNAGGLSISATSTTTSCVSSTGTIIATGSGGQGPLQYSKNGITFQSSGVFTGLAAGNYTITVKDANGCVASMTIPVNTITGPSVIATTTSTSCNSSNGTITAIGSSGTLPYLYSKNGITFQTSNLFTGLLPGPYTITIKDANLCTATTSVLVVNVGGGSGPTVSANTTSAECGQSDGKIDASSSGGQNPTRYSIDGVNYQSSHNFANLPPGTYTVYAMDANGCISFITVTIGNIVGPQVSATITPATCGNSNGSINATGFGGTPQYKYSIDGVNFQTGTTFSGLPSGYYTVTVRDADNVCRNSIVVYVGNSNGPLISTAKTDAYCGSNNGTITATGSGGTAPLSYSLDGINFQSSTVFASIAPGQYALTVQDASGCANITTVTVSAIAAPQVTVSPVSATCNNNNGSITVNGSNGTLPYLYSKDGITFQSSNLFSGLAAGTYTITLRDANDCISNTNVTLNNIPGPQLTTSTVASTCNNNNGIIIITGSNGTAPYEYSLDGINFQSSFLFTGLPSASDLVTIKDVNNCIATAPATIASMGAPAVIAASSSSSCGTGTGTITATGTGGTIPYEYSIDSTTFQSSNLFNCLPYGTYTVTVKDANGCLSTTTITVSLILPISLLYFSASDSAGLVALTWTTASEHNNDYFTVEKSRDGVNFQQVLIKDAAGNSTGLLNYFEVDPHPFSGTSYYRLKQTDFEGNVSYSKVVTVTIDIPGFSINSYYNPIEQSIHILFQGTRSFTGSLQLIDMTGRLILENQSFSGSEIKINAKGLAKGIYFLEVNDDMNGTIKRVEIY